MSDTIKITRGSSVTFLATWLTVPTVPPALPDPIDLTPYDVEVVFLHPALVGQLAVAVTDAAVGKWAATLTWADDMPIGRVMHFAARLVPKAGNPGLLPIASPRIWIEVTE